MALPLLFLLLAAGGGTAAGVGATKVSKHRAAVALDKEAARQQAINEITVGLGSAEAQNRFDEQQLAAMANQLQSAQAMLRSKDPRMQATGAARIQALDAAVRGTIQQNETEMRADLVRLQDREIAATGLGRADNEKRFEREMAMNNQVRDDLQPFGVAQVSYNKVMGLLDNNDQLASLAGLTAFVQAIDNSVVREGELLKYQGANGAITQLVNIVNKSEGKDFDEATKQSIRNASAALMNAEKTRAIAITNSHQDRAVAFGLDPRRVLSGVDEKLFTPIAIDRTVQEQMEAQADAAEAAFAAEPETFAVEDQSPGARATASFIAVSEELVRNTGILLRGSKLVRNEAGDLFELTKDGELVPITEAELLKATRASQAAVEADRQLQKTETPYETLLRKTPTHPINRPEARE